MHELKLGFDLEFYDLYKQNSLVKLDKLFIDYLLSNNLDLFNRLINARKFGLDSIEYSKLIIDIADPFDDFITKLFNIESEINDSVINHLKYDQLYLCKRNFIQRRVLKTYSKSDICNFDDGLIINEINQLIDNLDELNFAKHVLDWLDEGDQEKIDLAMKYSAIVCLSDNYIDYRKNTVLFNIPKKSDDIVAFDTEEINGFTIFKSKNHIKRLGFNLTDNGASLSQALNQANYCIYCHNQKKDSCSKGFKDNNDNFKVNSDNITLSGCPLEEKISEMNYLKSKAYIISALATAIIDNPMLAATGHRICNDCMRSCIYQKQDPVNIPEIETKVLKDVLDLPWGFEIYSLLTRWNPLNINNPLPKPSTDYKILIVGLGPAGFTLAHYLLNEGHIVVGIDGLKIEPIDPDLSGVNVNGLKTDFLPIKNVNSIYEDLDKRTQAGFGGVIEYGITVRFNKNFLKIIRLLLERRENFSMIGGVRFGSQLDTKKSFLLGFDHISLAVGAGAPNILNIAGNLNKGMRSASDFLMSLQLGGANKFDSISNLEIRMPIIVIGGGLTAIDTATEALAYYPMQVEKFLSRYNDNVSRYGIEKVRENWSEEDNIIADEFINHASLIREEKKSKNPDILKLMNNWGGVNIIYRGKLKDSPSYRYNKEEVEHALSEGIGFIENIIPRSIDLDRFGYSSFVITDDDRSINARTILFAIGTSPNNIITEEDSERYFTDDKYLQAIDDDNNVIKPERSVKAKNISVITYRNDDNKSVSFIGDIHPSYKGNVVSAMKGAKDAYKIISKELSKLEPNKDDNFSVKINNLARAKIKSIDRLSDNIIEIIIEAPLAAENFQPGQFYRLQNFDHYSKKINNTNLLIEGIALTGAIAYKSKGLISLIILEVGGSSDICANLSIDEEVTLMGPTGSPTIIDANKTVLIAGGGLGNAVLFSIGKAFRDLGSKIIYFAGYKKLNDRYKIEEIEKAADIVIWCCDESIMTKNRNKDISFHGNIVDAIISYAEGKFGRLSINIEDIDKIIAIGSDRMMNAINIARKNKLKSYLREDVESIASINSPMQCMMKEICAQCIQKHIDEDTGIVTYVYSCNNQDQDMNKVDFDFLNQRLKQNNVQEKITSLHIKHCLELIGLN